MIRLSGRREVVEGVAIAVLAAVGVKLVDLIAERLSKRRKPARKARS